MDLSAPPAGLRTTRDRRGRGMRGPGIMPARPGVPAGPTARQRFDTDVLAVVTLLEERWHARLPLVEYAVEETPWLPEGWGEEEVPLSSLVRGHAAEPHRVVLFRLPVQHRSMSRRQQRSIVMTLIVAHLADLMDLSPDEVDPRLT